MGGCNEAHWSHIGTNHGYISLGYDNVYVVDTHTEVYVHICVITKHKYYALWLLLLLLLFVRLFFSSFCCCCCRRLILFVCLFVWVFSRDMLCMIFVCCYTGIHCI